MYCSGIVTTEPVATDFYVITGPESEFRVGYEQGGFVYLNRGASQGVNVGDQFLVTRPVTDKMHVEWFAWQASLLRAMGQPYADIGRLRVVSVQPNIAIAQVVSSCGLMQRGDLVQPFVERPAPQFKTAGAFDRFAAPSRRAQAMIVATGALSHLAGSGSIVYVNLGSAQGAKVGDYFRIFRYAGEGNERVYQTRGAAYGMYGFGSTPVPYNAADLPREVLGEGIVLRVGPNASTVLVTLSQREIYAGNYVELE
jgi:hypothetical protein